MEEREPKSPSEMARALDSMDRDLTSRESDFLDDVIKTLKWEGKLSPKDEARLERLYEKYLGKKGKESETDEDEEEEEEPDEEEFA